MRRAQNADTHALKQHRLSQNISLVCSNFVLVIASDMHLESESENRAKNVDFHTAKNPDTSKTFSLFLDQFLYSNLRLIYFSVTCIPVLNGIVLPIRYGEPLWPGRVKVGM